MKSLNRKPKQRDLSTLQRLEASRAIKSTRYQPEWIMNYNKVCYLKHKQVASNQVLQSELFDEIIKVKQIGNIIHAIGYNNGNPTILTLEK